MLDLTLKVLVWSTDILDSDFDHIIHVSQAAILMMLDIVFLDLVWFHLKLAEILNY